MTAAKLRNLAARPAKPSPRGGSRRRTDYTRRVLDRIGVRVARASTRGSPWLETARSERLGRNGVRRPLLTQTTISAAAIPAPCLRPHLRARIPQFPQHAVRPPSTNANSNLVRGAADRAVMVAPRAQWPPSAARKRREGLSRQSTERAADAENYETGRRHSGLMELLGRICGGRDLATATMMLPTDMRPCRWS
jgi:hypothetical protein